MCVRFKFQVFIWNIAQGPYHTAHAVIGSSHGSMVIKVMDIWPHTITKRGHESNGKRSPASKKKVKVQVTSRAAADSSKLNIRRRSIDASFPHLVAANSFTFRRMLLVDDCSVDAALGRRHFFFSRPPSLVVIVDVAEQEESTLFIKTRVA